MTYIPYFLAGTEGTKGTTMDLSLRRAKPFDALPHVRIGASLRFAGTAPVVAAFGLGLWGLGTPSLWRDEVATWTTATRTPGQLWALFAHQDVVMAPYYLLSSLWMRVSTADSWLRLPSAVAMALAVALTMRIARRENISAAWAGSLLAVVPMTTRLAHEARPYAFVVAATAASLLLLLRALERPSPARWCAYAAALAAVGALHAVALAALLGHGVVVWVRRRDLVRGWLAATASAVCVCAPLVAAGYRQRGQIAWIERPGLSVDGLGTAALVFGDGRLFSVALVAATAVALVVRPACRTPRLLLPAVCALLPIAAVFAVSQWVPIWVPRYLAFTLPACCLGIAAVADRIPRHVAGIAVSALAPMLIPPHLDLRTTWAHGDDPKAVAIVVEKHARAGDAMLYGNGSWMTRAAMDRYLGQARPPDPLVVTPASRRGTLDAAECADPRACLEGVQRLWHVHTVDGYDRLEPAKVALLRSTFRHTRRWSVPGLTVVDLWERRPAPVP